MMTCDDDENQRLNSLMKGRMSSGESRMNAARRPLIRSSLIVAPLIFGASILPDLAQAEVPNADPNALVWFPGHSFCMKATGKDTGGATAWLMAENGPR